MRATGGLRAAVVGRLAPRAPRAVADPLLQSIVEGRALRPRAPRPPRSCSSSPYTDELVFEVVVGRGRGTTGAGNADAGPNSGIAGWVLQVAGVLDRSRTSKSRPGDSPARSPRDPATSNWILAVPLLHDEAAIGVLAVYRPQQVRFSLAEVRPAGELRNPGRGGAGGDPGSATRRGRAGRRGG